MNDELLKSRVVMVVDDQSEARAPICEFLRRLKCTIIEAVDGQDALERSLALPGLELLITDIVMPRLDGAELTERLLESHPDLKVLLISGFVAGPSVQRLLQSPRVDFLEKPFSFRNMAARASNLLRGQGWSRAATNHD